MAEKKQSASPASSGLTIPPEILAGLTAGGPTSTKHLIGGLPDDFATGITPSDTAVQTTLEGAKAGKNINFTEAKGKASYYDGDEAALFQGLRPAEIQKLQMRLYDAGFLEGEFRYGDVTDASTQKALTALLYSANIAGTDYESTLSFAENSGVWFDPTTGGFKKGKRPTGKLPTSLSDPTNLYEVAQGVASNVIGRRLSDQEARQFVDKFHGIEQANDAGNLDAPNLELYADKYAQQADPTAYEGQSLVNVFQEAMKTIGGGIETQATRPIQGGQIKETM